MRHAGWHERVAPATTPVAYTRHGAGLSEISAIDVSDDADEFALQSAGPDVGLCLTEFAAASPYEVVRLALSSCPVHRNR